ncbi:MAG: ABC transporter permease [Bacteroidales bacterium]|jgi:ribose/xylose/arabinose/galactoside ABC-type transport system permease subunit|nr:ABC transporter permease [Bacteroidales bacterium]
MIKKSKAKSLNIGFQIFLIPEIGVLLPILILVIITTIINPNFLTRRYLSSILIGSVSIGAAALGEAFVIMSGEIDLSVGYIGCLAGIICGKAAMAWGWGPVPAILLGLFVGILVGFINGFISSKIGLSSWITTISTQFICQGVATTIAQGYQQSVSSFGLQSFTRVRPLGLTWIFFIFIILIIIMDCVLRKTPFGYKLRALGGNRNAAEMAGIDVKNVKIIAFILAGLFAAMGGLFDTLQNGGASDAFGAGREFRAITCCAIGGISMTGCSGSIFGVGLGVLLFHTIWYCLRILNLSPNAQMVLIGFILILAVIFDLQRKRIEDHRLI